MGISNYFSAQWHDLILNGVAIPNLADDAAASPATNLYVALHTASPAVGGDQTANETTYTGYARVAVERDGTRWTIADNVATLVGDITFAQATGGSGTLTHFSIGMDASGAGEVLYFDTLKDSGGSDTTLAVSENVQPQIDAGATLTLS